MKCLRGVGGAGYRRMIEQNVTMREWLDWLTRVRLLMITLILAIGVVWPQSVLISGTTRFFLPLIIF